MSVRVLGSEDCHPARTVVSLSTSWNPSSLRRALLTRRNLVNPLHISSDTHLLGQLRALRQERLALEIVDLEHAGTGFRGGSLELGRVDLDEAERVEVRSEEVGHGGLETEDGLVGGCLAVGVADSELNPLSANRQVIDSPSSP